MLCMLWLVGGLAQTFPYQISVQTVPGHCYDDAHLIITITDDNGNVVPIDTQTHNAANTAQYPLYNVQYHYQNTAGGGVQYDYSNDIMLMAGTYSVGVTANVPTQGGYALVDTTISNVQITTSYNYLETNALSNIAYDTYDGFERYGYRASFHCADVGRIQLRIVHGSFPYTVTILNEQQDTVRHRVFYHNANSGNNQYAANYRDYYNFDSLPIGTYSIYVSDSCGYTVPLTFNIPDFEPTRYLGLVNSNLSSCLDETIVPFILERRYPSGVNAMWCNYNYSYLDSILLYRFINPGGDTTEWKNMYSPGNPATWVSVYDTFPSYCDIFYDTIKMQLHDLCHDTLMTYSFKFLPRFGFLDSTDVVYQQDTIIHDTCATHLQNGISSQTYKIWGGTWTDGGKSYYGYSAGAQQVPFRYYRCPLSYNIWSLPDSTLLGHAQSDEFTGLGTWETFFVDTSIHVYASVTDAQGCLLADKDTVLVYQTAPVDDLLYWFECHNDKDDDGKDHCCPDRYLWIQEHGVDADIFRRNMTLRLSESPLYNQFNFTAIRQDGVWTVTPDDPNNHSTYVEFSYEDGWRATVRDSVCLPPGRYTFEVSTDCGEDTITYSWAGYYYDTIYFVSAPQYDIQQRCGEIVYTQVSTGLESHMYFINPEVSNDIPEDTIPYHPCSNYSSQGGNDYRDSQGRNVIAFSIPGTYVITNYAYNSPYSNCVGWCTDYQHHYDTIIVAFAHLDFEMASALLCGSSSEMGVVTAQAINGNAPYTYTLYSQSGALIASNSSGIFEDVPMSVGQQFIVQVTDSCSTSFSITITATQLTHESLLWEQGPHAAQPHCVGDSVHLTAFTFPPPATYQWTGPNGFSSTLQSNDIVVPANGESGWYKVTILNSVCGPVIMDSVYVSVAPTPQVNIFGADTVCSGGNITLQVSVNSADMLSSEMNYVWNTGDTTATITVNPTQTTEYSVTATSAFGCSETASHTVTVTEIAPIVDTVYLCHDTTAVLTARAAAAYLWSTGDTTQFIPVSSSGFYFVTATSSEGCLVVDTFEVITVKVNTISEIDLPDMCAGENYAITVGYVSSCNLIFQTHETILALNDTVFLPDGADCLPYGCSYRSPLHFAGYDDDAVVNDVNDIRYVRINLEHSFAGDIYINLTCPNGQKADILKWGDYQQGFANTACSSYISANSKGWQSDTEDVYNAAQGTDFGLPNKQSDSEHPCDASRPKNMPGSGWNYCWSNNTSEGYIYAGGTGSLIYRECNAIPNLDATPTYYWGVPMYPKSFDSSNVATGTQFYHPDQSFASLIGCPLNGNWYIEVMDGAQIDNGYIFGWELALAEDIPEVVYADVVQTTVEGPWVVSTSDSSFVFSPPADLAHDTLVQYTFHCFNEYGCGFDTIVNIWCYARSIVTTDTTACNSFTWNGVTYTADTTLTDTLDNIHGCDSIVTLHIHVITTPTVTISGSQFFCPDSSVVLIAVSDASPQSYLWSTGETTPSITVSEAGAYTVTAFFAGGCNAESENFHVFESENPIANAHLSDMVAGDTQTVIIGIMTNDNLQYYLPQSTLTYSNVTFLPDGVPCGDPPSCSYVAEMTFSGFPDTATIQSVEDIRYIRLKMEHSFIGDLYINLTCPNGQHADILKKYQGNSTSVCLNSISSSHIGWQSGNVIQDNPTFPPLHTYFGAAYWKSDQNHCDKTQPNNQPGVGWNYCWSNNTVEGYQYAPGAGSLVYRPENVHSMSINYVSALVVDSSDVQQGLHFYHPDESFDSLVGCPLNGIWTIEVIDGVTNDNGYIFESELSVAEYLTSEHYAPIVQMDFDSSWVIRLNDSTFIITPPNDLANDTVVAYTFTLVDENGCTFDTTVSITIYAHQHYDEYDTVYVTELETYTWHGYTFTQAGSLSDTLHTIHGADSVITLHLSVIYPYDTVVCENVFPIIWHNQTFSGADTLMIFHPLNGADSIEQLMLTTNPVFLITLWDTICEGDSYIFHNQSITETGTYYDTLQTFQGCDSIIAVNLTVNPIYHISLEQEICQGESYLFKGDTLQESGIYYDTLQTIHHCDSIISLTLTVNPTRLIFGTDTICEGDSVYFYGKMLTEAGTYYDTLQTVHGCDSVMALTLVVNPTYFSSITQEMCQGDSLVFHGKTLTQSGIYYDTLHTVSGCDSIVRLTLTVYPVHHLSIPQQICQGDTFVFNGKALYEPDVYIDTLSSIHGCDSIVTLTLTVQSTLHTDLEQAICTGDSILFKGQFIHTQGVFHDTLSSASGCDSIITLTVTENPTYNVSVSDTICQGDSISFHGQMLSMAGAYVDTLQTVHGCDSVVTLNLVVNPVQHTSITEAICQGDSLDFFGVFLHEEGTYYDTLQTVQGCDSIVTLTLTTNPIYQIPVLDTICEGDNYVFHNKTLYESGVYKDTLQTVQGCDSIIELVLTVSPVTFGVDTVSACDSIIWIDGNTYSFSTDTVTFTLESGNMFGCDSVVTLHFTVLHSTDSLLEVTVFENDLPYTLNGMEYQTSGQYTQPALVNANGCDSTIYLQLEVILNVHKYVSATICESMLPALWAGHTWTEAGTIIDTFPAANGADSIVVKTLKVGASTDTTIVAEIVENLLPYTLNNNDYYETGIYLDTLMNQAGCDSIITLNLTVHYNVQTFTDSVICEDLLPILWDSVYFTAADTQVVTHTAASGADSIVTMVLLVNPLSDSTIVDTILQNNLPYILNGEYYDTTGVYTQTFENAYGCDSTLTLGLTVLYNVTTLLDSTICDSLLPIVWNGIPFTAAGVQDTTMMAANGADSIVVMTLHVHYHTYGTLYDTVLENNLPTYTLNGIAYDSAGTYTQSLTSAGGCDSTLTLYLTVLYNVSASADSTICESQLPFVWNGVTFLGADTQTVVLTAPSGVDSTLTMTVHVVPSPNAHITGPSMLCTGSYTILTADSAFSYLWNTNATTQSIEVNSTGVYSVTVTSENGCVDTASFQISNAVTVDPLVNVHLMDLCAGSSHTFTTGYNPTDNFVIGGNESTLSMTDTVFLPDGVYCSPFGCSYQSPLTFTDFAQGATVTNVNDIRYVRLNMEHSFAADIYINITCPNGQKADILRFDGYANTTCSSLIPASSLYWQNGSNASGSTDFGMAYSPSTSGSHACDPTYSSNAPGVGWNYCWSNNTSEGYTYAPGAGSLIYRSNNAHNGRFDSSNVALGTKFYHPDQSFESLIGCPLNGSWYIEVLDGYNIDNGYIFGWELALASTVATMNYTDVVAVDVDGPWVESITDTSFTITPPATLTHDTVVTYTVHFYDEYGCGYDTSISLNVYVPTHLVIDTTVCGSFVWNGITYMESDTIVQMLTNVHGCDSIIEVYLHLYPNPTTVITGLPVPCVDTVAHLIAVSVDSAATIIWSTGDTSQTLTVTSSCDVGLTASNAGGCHYDTTFSVTFSSHSNIVIDTTVCDQFVLNGHTYTQTGLYYDTLPNSQGCDSIISIDLTVNHSAMTSDTLYLFQNQLPYHFVPSDTTFAVNSPAEFQFTYVLPTQQNCDSVILQKVFIYQNVSFSFDTTICQYALPLQWHGHTFTGSATVIDSLQTVHGSDSVLTYTVTVDMLGAVLGNVTHINCYGENTGAATVTVSGGTAPLIYQWTNGSGTTVSTSTQISNRPAGAYTFTVTDAIGCTATVSVTLNTLHGEMQAGTISGPQILCIGDTFGLVTGTAATGDDCVYQWQVSTDGSVWNPASGTNNTQNYNNPSLVTNPFQLRRAWISADCGTLYSNVLEVSVWPVQNDTIYDDVCVGSPYHEHGFDISETETVGLGVLTSVKYYTSIHGCDSTVVLILDIHEPQETEINVEICEGDGYYQNGFYISAEETVGADTLHRVLNLQSIDECDSVVRLNVSVIDTALRIVCLTPDFCEEMQAELMVVSGMVNYEWSTGEQMPTITVTSPGIYKVTASEGGCSVTAKYAIEPCVFQIYLPNAITPGRGDGLNDYFYIPEKTQSQINLFEISIFNRWGEQVFYSTDKAFMWNGEVKGKIYPQNVYNYIINYTDSAGRPYQIVGSVTVL